MYLNNFIIIYKQSLLDYLVEKIKWAKLKLTDLFFILKPSNQMMASQHFKNTKQNKKYTLHKHKN